MINSVKAKSLYFAGSAGEHGIVAFCKVNFEKSSGRLNFSKTFQQDAKDLNLAERLTRKAQRMTQRESGINCSRGFHLTGDLFGQANGDSRNSRRFNDALDQSHGLIAEASGRCEDGRIDAVLL